MSEAPSVLLRVKRPLTETPVECFSAIPTKRLRCQKADYNIPASFRYLGSTSALTDTTRFSTEDLHNYAPLGKTKLFLSSNSTAHVVDPETSRAVPCKVRFSKAAKRKADDSEEVASRTSPSSSPRPPSPKSLRVIDILYEPHPESPSPTLHRATGGRSRSNDKDEKEDVLVDKIHNGRDFIYDVYAPVTRLDDENEDGLEPPFEGIYEGDSDEFDERYFCDDEDSDSNSESNWRNDYPDEEDDDFMDKRLITRFRGDYDDDTDEEKDDDDEDDDDESELDEYRYSSDVCEEIYEFERLGMNYRP
ncbi:unnamed protein product [Mesocestoides corti]|uniref:RNA polymerase II nuclear localization protein SLC7A6OS n=1 Tax=Mesocestoides corti TaxID=53468 RepID=A0A0R3UIH4_MESCO|nr:unnamed protein product [Mesocestoides corti]